MQELEWMLFRSIAERLSTRGHLIAASLGKRGAK